MHVRANAETKAIRPLLFHARGQTQNKLLALGVPRGATITIMLVLLRTPHASKCKYYDLSREPLLKNTRSECFSDGIGRNFVFIWQKQGGCALQRYAAEFDLRKVSQRKSCSCVHLAAELRFIRASRANSRSSKRAAQRRATKSPRCECRLRHRQRRVFMQ